MTTPIRAADATLLVTIDGVTREIPCTDLVVHVEIDRVGPPPTVGPGARDYSECLAECASEHRLLVWKLDSLYPFRDYFHLAAGVECLGCGAVHLTEQALERVATALGRIGEACAWALDSWSCSDCGASGIEVHVCPASGRSAE